MTRLLQVAVVIAVLLVARRVLFGWLKQPDTLPRLLREAVDALVGWFIYITAGMLALSLIAGRGFGAGNQLEALAITIGAAIYVGAGILALWALSGRQETRSTRR